MAFKKREVVLELDELNEMEAELKKLRSSDNQKEKKYLLDVILAISKKLPPTLRMIDVLPFSEDYSIILQGSIDRDINPVQIVKKKN